MAGGGLYNILDLAGIDASILFKEHQQQESPEESPAAAGKGAESRIHGRGAAAVGTRWAVAEATTAAAAETEPEAVPVQKSCKENQISASPPLAVPCLQLASALHLLCY